MDVHSPQSARLPIVVPAGHSADETSGWRGGGRQGGCHQQRQGGKADAAAGLIGALGKAGRRHARAGAPVSPSGPVTDARTARAGPVDDHEGVVARSALPCRGLAGGAFPRALLATRARHPEVTGGALWKGSRCGGGEGVWAGVVSWRGGVVVRVCASKGAAGKRNGGMRGRSAGGRHAAAAPGNAGGAAAKACPIRSPEKKRL